MQKAKGLLERNGQTRAECAYRDEELKFKESLRIFLDKNCWSAAELARRSGVSKQVISGWLSGVQPRSFDHVKAVASCFEVSLDDLIYPSVSRTQVKTRHLEANFLLPSKKPTLNQNAFATVTKAVREHLITWRLDGQILDCSSHLASEFGWSQQELVGRSLIEFVAFSDRQRFISKFHHDTSDSRSTSDVFCRLLCKNHDLKWVKVSSLVLVDGGISCSQLVVLDDTLPTEKEKKTVFLLDSLIKEANGVFKLFGYPIQINYGPNAKKHSVFSGRPSQVSAVLIGSVLQYFWDHTGDGRPNSPMAHAKNILVFEINELNDRVKISTVFQGETSSNSTAKSKPSAKAQALGDAERVPENRMRVGPVLEQWARENGISICISGAETDLTIDIKKTEQEKNCAQCLAIMEGEKN